METLTPENITAQDISNMLSRIIDKGTRGKQITEGVIVSVDMTKYTCVINTSSGTYTGVPLMVLIGSEASVTQIPAIGSNVLMGFRDGNSQRPQLLYVDTCSEFDITIGDSKLKVTSGLFQFNGGNNGGMVLVNNLVSQVNTLQTLVNSMLAILQTIAVPSTPYDIGALFAALMAVALTTAGDIQSTKIVQ